MSTWQTWTRVRFGVPSSLRLLPRLWPVRQPKRCDPHPTRESRAPRPGPRPHLETNSPLSLRPLVPSSTRFLCAVPALVLPPAPFPGPSTGLRDRVPPRDPVLSLAPLPPPRPPPSSAPTPSTHQFSPIAWSSWCRPPVNLPVRGLARGAASPGPDASPARQDSCLSRFGPHQPERCWRERTNVQLVFLRLCNNLILLSQPQGQNLDKIVVSVPLTPAHGAVARLQSQVTAERRRPLEP